MLVGKGRATRHGEGGMAQFLAFLGIAILVIVTPGQDTALTIRNTLLGGRRARGIYGGGDRGRAGGLDARHERGAGGAARRVGTGVRRAEASGRGVISSSSARRRSGGRCAAARATARARRRCWGDSNRWRRCGRGRSATSATPRWRSSSPACCRSSPRPIAPPSRCLLALGLLFCLLTLTWLTGYAFVVARAGDFLRRPRIRRTLDGIMGTVLIAFGVRLATAQR